MQLEEMDAHMAMTALVWLRIEKTKAIVLFEYAAQISPHQFPNSLAQGAYVQSGSAAQGLLLEVHGHLPVPVAHHHFSAVGA